MADPLQHAKTDPVVVWAPQPGPQTALLQCPVFEVFYGGARGGGKTDGVLGEWVSHADLYGEGAVGLMVRRERTQLLETIERSRQIYRPLGARYHEQDKMWRFPNGARLRFAYLESDADADAYQGHSYTRVYAEELGTFPNQAPVQKLMATLRSGSGVPVGFRATGNPGGPGHGWVKARYIDPAPLGWRVMQRSFTDPYTGESVSRDWVYIPSSLKDNKYLGAEYVAALQMSGSAELVRAWLHGDWDVVAGAFFDCFSREKHVLQPFEIPGHWLRFLSLDWGSAHPFSCGWWAVASEDYAVDGRLIPRGALVRYREWYGASSPNKGLKLTAEEVAAGIRAREAGDSCSYRVADPATFASDGGPSIIERMSKVIGGWRRADNTRVARLGHVGGWDQVRQRLIGDGDRPMMYTFNNCDAFIRTIPALQHDPDRPEDLDTHGEDHVADETRYACMSRPYVRLAQAPVSEMRFGAMTMAQALERLKARAREREW